MEYHVPVLLTESIDGLNICEAGIYVDVTFGGGGHSREILKATGNGKVIGVDQDEDAVNEAKTINEENFIFIKTNFRYLTKYLRLYGIKKVDGILADLGVSSWQLDVADRGFSTRFSGHLDMRMDRLQNTSARDIVNNSEPKELQRIFSEYGEVRNAKTLATKISTTRINQEINLTSELIEIIKPLAPRNKENKYFAQVFQALRIAVNDEIEALKEFLKQSSDLLKDHGRLVVISYHSLEDRIVKNYINKGDFSGEPDKDLYGNVIRPFKPVNRKPIIPPAAEVISNPRSRSAKLRIGEKI
ncbi:16S rRNA (cytosine(1402)-N(4))-methyltransferase RsmH [Bacteroidota bacterium]